MKPWIWSPTIQICVCMCLHFFPFSMLSPQNSFVQLFNRTFWNFFQKKLRTEMETLKSSKLLWKRKVVLILLFPPNPKRKDTMKDTQKTWNRLADRWSMTWRTCLEKCVDCSVATLPKKQAFLFSFSINYKQLLTIQTKWFGGSESTSSGCQTLNKPVLCPPTFIH